MSVSLAVLDSYAVLAYLQKEPGSSKIVELFKKVQKKEAALFLSLINWGEVYYNVARTSGAKTAEEALLLIHELPIDVVDIDRETVYLAAQLKSLYPIAYADCFAAALAKQKRCPLWTGDPEFKRLHNEIEIHWM